MTIYLQLNLQVKEVEHESNLADSDIELDDDGEKIRYKDEMIGGEAWGKKKQFFYGGNPNERFKPGAKPGEEDGKSKKRYFWSTRPTHNNSW